MGMRHGDDGPTFGQLDTSGPITTVSANSIRRTQEWGGDEISAARIGDQLTFMAQQISKVRELLNDLEGRIEPVLMPSFPSDKACAIDSPERKPSSELSNTIDDLNSLLSGLQSKIYNIWERVQL